VDGAATAKDGDRFPVSTSSTTLTSSFQSTHDQQTTARDT